MSKSMVWTAVAIGGTIGSAIPLLWGAGEFSFSSVIFGGLGSLAGIWVAYKMSYTHY